MTKTLLRIAAAVILLAACKKEKTTTQPTPTPDTTPPAITLNGKSSDTTNMNSTYADPGATATDDRDGNISSRITVSGTVSTNEIGGNYLYYTVKDAAGNSADATRYVYVRNAAYRLVGTYNVISDCGSNFSGLSSTSVVQTSTMYNNRITISNQQFQSSGFNVTADVNGNSLSMATQPVGSSLATGTGTISADMRSFTLTTSYTPAIQGSSGCTIVYTKQ